MKIKILYKALSMLLTVAMVLNMGLTPVFAEGTAIGASGLTDCHTAHDSECGYSETIQMGGCTHAHTEECYTKELTCALSEGEAPEITTDSDATADEAHSHGEDCYTQTETCLHEHDDTCGYGETVTVTPCAHTCEVCDVLDSGKPAEKVCNCGAVDSGNLPHGEDCPLYIAPELSAAVQALIAMVDALPNAAEITEENKEATIPAFEAAVEAYEALQDVDKAAFEQTEQYTKLMALREVLFGIAMMADSPVTLNISDASAYIEITNTGYKVGATDEITYAGDYIITGTATSTNAESNHVMVSGGTHNITLKDATIQLVAADKCAFVVDGNSSVNLTLEGENALKSGKARAGLEVATGNTITIVGAGTVAAIGGYTGAGIGGNRGATGGTIIINGGTVNAFGGESGAGIGGGSTGAGGTININGGTVNATGGNSGGAGIGGGSTGTGGTITIEGGTVNATSIKYGAGIGGGQSGAGGTINISGGTVNATGNSKGAGIGGGGGGGAGQNGAGGTITITDNAVVFATKGSDASNHIGGAGSNSEGTINRNGGIIFEGNAGKAHGNVTIGAGQTLTIPTGNNLTVPESVTLTNNGRLEVLGTTDGGGTLDGDGVMQMALKDSMIALDKNSYIYTGQPIIPTVTVPTVTFFGKTLTFAKDTDYTVTFADNTAASEAAKVTVTPTSGSTILIGTAVEKLFTITQSGTEFTGGVTVEKADKAYTYGEIISVKVTPTATGAPKTRALAEPQPNQLALYKGDVQLTEPQTVTNGTELTFTIDTKDKTLTPGSNTITAKYTAGTNMAEQSGTVDITLNKKVLTATVTGGATATKVYNGNAELTGVVLTLTGLEVGDTISATANGTAADASVGAAKAFTATTAPALTGTGAAYYSLASDAVSGNVAITPVTPSVKVTVVKQEKSFLRSIIGDHNDTIILTATTEGVNDESPNGTVVFKNGAITLATKPTTDGIATYEWKNPPTGNYTITAEFAASDSNYISTAVIGTADGFDIDKGTQDDLAVVVPTLTYGDTGKSLSTTGGSGAGAVTYAVTEGNCITVNANTGAITVVKEGDAKVTATKAADDNFNSITSGETQIKVNLATPTVAWASDTQTLIYTGEAAAITPPTVTLVDSETYSGEITYTYTAPARLSNLFGLFAGESDTLPKDVGVYEVTAHIAANGNYTAADSNTMTLTITKSTPTLTINSYTGKTYDGNAVIDPTNITSNVTTPTVNYTYYLAGGMTKTTKANSGASGTGKAPVNAGDYKVTGTIEETPNTKAITSAAVNFTIAQKVLTVIGGTVTPKKWDNSTSATVTELTFSDLISGETFAISTDYTVGTPTFDNVNVGENKPVTGTATLVENAKTKNYSLTGTFVNVKGNITLADGPTAPTNGVVNNSKDTDTFTFDSTSGVIYEYQINNGTWTEITASGAITTISVGNIFVPEGGLQVRVKATSTHKEGEVLSNAIPFTTTIDGSVAIDGAATYGETLTANVTGVQNGAVLFYEWKSGDTVLKTNQTNTYKISKSDVGKNITVTVTATDYDGKLSARTAAVARRNLTVTAHATDKEYDGNTTATVDFTFGDREIVEGDTVSATATTVFTTKDAGANKQVDITDFKLNDEAEKYYTVSLVTTSTTANITKKVVTVSADNQTMVKYGELPTFTVTYEGFIGSENENNAALETLAEATTATDGETIGEFDITFKKSAILNTVAGDNYKITNHVNGTLTVSEKTYKITANAGTGGTISPNGEVTVDEGGSKTFIIAASNNHSIESVSVDGVNKGKINTYTFEDIMDDHTISATFSSNGSGGGSTGGSGIITPPLVDEVNKTNEAVVKIESTIDDQGHALVEVNDKMIKDAIKEAKKNGNKNDEINLVLSVETGNKTVNDFTVNLSKEVLNQVISEEITNTSIVVDNLNIQIKLDLGVITEINKQAKSDVSLNARKVTDVGNRPAFDLTVNYGNNQLVKDFKKGNVSVSIPYTLQNNEIAGNVYAIYLDGNNQSQRINASSYDSIKKVLRFTTNHFTTFGVGYKLDSPSYTDITNHWAKEDIEYVTARGLLTGSTATTFSPDALVTRGMIVRALAQLADVDEDAYVEWAIKNKILTKNSSTISALDQAITREEMAMIFNDYAKSQGFTLPKAREAIQYTDDSIIDAQASVAVKNMQMAGIIMGKDKNKFEPKMLATKAEASAALHRYIELILDLSTAQGFDKNDSGSVLYYEAGKPVIGHKTILGKDYEFGNDGILIKKAYPKYQWVAAGSHWYYLIDGVTLRSSWIASDAIGSKWYYVNNEGQMVRNTTIDGCAINSDGVWIQ